MHGPRQDGSQEQPEKSSVVKDVVAEASKRIARLPQGGASSDQVLGIISQLRDRLCEVRELESQLHGCLGDFRMKRDYEVVDSIPVTTTPVSNGHAHVGLGSAIRVFRVLGRDKVIALDTGGRVACLSKQSDGSWQDSTAISGHDIGCFEMTPSGSIAAVTRDGLLVIAHPGPRNRWTMEVFRDKDMRLGAPVFGLQVVDDSCYVLSFGAVSVWEKDSSGKYHYRAIFESPGMKHFRVLPDKQVLSSSVTQMVSLWSSNGKRYLPTDLVGTLTDHSSHVGNLPDGRLFSLDAGGVLNIFDRQGAGNRSWRSNGFRLSVNLVWAYQQDRQGTLILHNEAGVHVVTEGALGWQVQNVVNVNALDLHKPGLSRTTYSQVIPDGRIFVAMQRRDGACSIEILDGKQA